MSMLNYTEIVENAALCTALGIFFCDSDVTSLLDLEKSEDYGIENWIQ